MTFIVRNYVVIDFLSEIYKQSFNIWIWVMNSLLLMSVVKLQMTRVDGLKGYAVFGSSEVNTSIN